MQKEDLIVVVGCVGASVAMLVMIMVVMALKNRRSQYR